MLGWFRRKYRDWLLSQKDVVLAKAQAINQQHTLSLVRGEIEVLTDLAAKQNLHWPMRPNGMLYEAIKRVYAHSKYSMAAVRYPFPIVPAEDQDGSFIGFIYNPQSDLVEMRWMLAAHWLEQPEVEHYKPEGK